MNSRTTIVNCHQVKVNFHRVKVKSRRLKVKSGARVQNSSNRGSSEGKTANGMNRLWGKYCPV